jgi:hypothetical protein
VANQKNEVNALAMPLCYSSNDVDQDRTQSPSSVSTLRNTLSPMLILWRSVLH